MLVAIPRSDEEENEETIIVEEDREKPQESTMQAKSQDNSAFHVLKTIFSFRNMDG